MATKKKNESWFDPSELPPLREAQIGVPGYYLSRQCEFFKPLKCGFYKRLVIRKCSPNRKRNGGTVNYLYIGQSRPQGMTAHKAEMLTWGTPPPDDGRLYDIHHKNGNPKDNCIDNLVWLEKWVEHRKWDNRLKRLKAFFREGLLLWSYADFDRWYAMPDSEFDAMLKIDRVDPFEAASEERNKYA